MSLLPTARSEIVKDPSQTRFYFYGAPGVGKTTFGSKFRRLVRRDPDGTEHWAEPLFACTEEGVNFLSVYKTTIKDWGSFKQLLKDLEAADPQAEKFSCVVVDTIDLLFTMCERFVCDAKNIAHPSDLEWGKGWAALRDEFQVVLSYVSRMKQGLVLIGHAKVWEKKERGSVVTCVQPNLSGTGRKVVLPIVDVILYGEIKEVVDVTTGSTYPKRIMHTQPNETIEAKDRTRCLPPVLNMDYEELASYIRAGKEYHQPEPAGPPATQTPTPTPPEGK